MCHISVVMCHISVVMCHISGAMYHNSLVMMYHFSLEGLVVGLEDSHSYLCLSVHLVQIFFNFVSFGILLVGNFWPLSAVVISIWDTTRTAPILGQVW